MSEIGRNLIVTLGGLAIGLLVGFEVTAWASRNAEGAGDAIGVLIMGSAATSEATVGAIVSLVLLANGRRRAAAVAAFALGLVLLGEYVWLST
jgi:hypothetical protein